MVVGAVGAGEEGPGLLECLGGVEEMQRAELGYWILEIAGEKGFSEFL
jgi:hypothetical protein